jgi:hypothetical protein
MRAAGFALAVLAASVVAVPGAATATATPLVRLDVPRDLKVVSYFPADAGWTRMWTDWQPDRIDADLARAASLHANTVRAIVQPNLFGYPHPSALYASRLERFVALAAAHRLHVQLTLFDWWYRWRDLRGSRTWARELLARYANDPRIAFVEVRNEVLPKPQVVAWLRVMIPFVRTALGGHTPVTVSVAGRDPTTRLARLVRALRNVRPDFWDVHEFGGGAELLHTSLERASAAAAPAPVWVGETGYPTTTASTGYGGVPLTDSAQEAAQGHFLATASWAAHAAGLPAIGIWALEDLAPAAVPNRVPLPTDPELHFGLFRTDGTAKPAAAVVRAVFMRGVAPASFNGGFEQAVTGEDGRAVPAQWSLDGDAAFTEDPEQRREGARSARVVLARPDATASLSIVPPDAAAPAGRDVVVRAWAERSSAAGSVFLVVEWRNAADRVVGRDASQPVATTGAWQRLAVAAHSPRGAAYARIELVVRGTTAPAWFDGVSFRRAGGLRW